MTAHTFFDAPEGLTVSEIAELTGAKPRAGTDLGRVVRGIATLQQARPADLTFFENFKYVDQLADTGAGVCLTTERFAERVSARVAVLLTSEPFRDFVAVARELYPNSLRPHSMFDAETLAPGAHVHPTAEIEDGVTIDPGAVIGPRAAIGSGTIIGPNVAIGPDVHIGRDCSVGPGTAIMHSLVGDNVVFHGGCQIGQDGFRYRMTAKGHVKVPQLGRVIIQDHVEIGANTAIDRGGLGDTVIGEGTKIDNLVHIGHNCIIGRHCVIAGQCGFAGSVTLGDGVVLGGQVGVADHLTIGDGTMIGGKSGVVSNIPPGERWLGFPAMPGREFLRVTAALRKRI
ncbi:UDP-3-O-(3-hydroxymyristoyl)glucosamine N-acyltransferase [Rhodoplanes sp. Z2-YC6860]|uniref:UDP-3-O-(3-hydroxymyristoyl)glucosamine N-acyltransferase n=1 Tax=Rhodoplanes sp. Z2-YC6860 TaxID=674703 RepID=UPI00078BD5A3|nr:UDP-3-O-(3-hydroxymyristoyl)glucosamine N-acyltransferase [Rhodoplanes sp. Z2-YC6860]AMN41938.1 UDP-3-O-[3-hydroxymyristoyl] glucosamine N-acyltransferase [Rhodoplanes sp. Z2-YC6860]